MPDSRAASMIKNEIDPALKEHYKTDRTKIATTLPAAYIMK